VHLVGSYYTGLNDVSFPLRVDRKNFWLLLNINDCKEKQSLYEKLYFIVIT